MNKRRITMALCEHKLAIWLILKGGKTAELAVIAQNPPKLITRKNDKQQ